MHITSTYDQMSEVSSTIMLYFMKQNYVPFNIHFNQKFPFYYVNLNMTWKNLSYDHI